VEEAVVVEEAHKLVREPGVEEVVEAALVVCILSSEDRMVLAR
jgi:hypothetical protein